MWKQNSFSKNVEIFKDKLKTRPGTVLEMIYLNWCLSKPVQSFRSYLKCIDQRNWIWQRNSFHKELTGINEFRRYIIN